MAKRRDGRGHLGVVAPSLVGGVYGPRGALHELVSSKPVRADRHDLAPHARGGSSADAASASTLDPPLDDAPHDANVV